MGDGCLSEWPPAGVCVPGSGSKQRRPRPTPWVTLLLAWSLPGSVAPEGHVTLPLDGIVFDRTAWVTGTHSQGAVGRADAQTPRLRCYYLWFVVVTVDLEASLTQSYICGDKHGLATGRQSYLWKHCRNGLRSVSPRAPSVRGGRGSELNQIQKQEARLTHRVEGPSRFLWTRMVLGHKGPRSPEGVAAMGLVGVHSGWTSTPC